MLFFLEFTVIENLHRHPQAFLFKKNKKKLQPLRWICMGVKHLHNIMSPKRTSQHLLL